MALFSSKKKKHSQDADPEEKPGPQVVDADEAQPDDGVAIDTGESRGFMQTLKRIGKRFKFDSHHAIERFGVIVAIFAVSGAALFISAGFSAHSNSQAQLSATALYTQTFTTSRTQVSGKVEGVYTDPSKTRTMVLLSTRDDSRLPSNAKDYQFFLTGTDVNLNQHSLKNAPITGRYVTFGGDSTYMAVVLDNPQQFDLQILDLTVRINREVSYKENSGAAETEKPQSGSSSDKKDPNAGDNSFQQYDQSRILFNPVATGAVETELGAAGSDFNAGEVYHEVVTLKNEQELRDQMDGQLLQMQADLAKIDQYMTQVATTTVDDRGTMLRLDAPEVPEVIAGDKVTGQDAKSAKDKTSSLFLDSGTVVPGGYDFDWRQGSVESGYLDQVVPKGMSYVDFMKSQAELGAPTPDWQKVEFTLSNGTPLTTYTNRDTFVKPLLDLRTNLITSWQTYYEHKVGYQVDSYNDLLKLEIELRNVSTNTVQNTDKDVLTLY